MPSELEALCADLLAQAELMRAYSTQLPGQSSRIHGLSRQLASATAGSAMPMPVHAIQQMEAGARQCLRAASILVEAERAAKLFVQRTVGGGGSGGSLGAGAMGIDWSAAGAAGAGGAPGGAHGTRGAGGVGRYLRAPAGLGERCEFDDGVFAHSTTSQGWAFLNAKDDAAPNAAKIRHLHGWFDVMLHGSPDSVQVPLSGGWVRGLSAQGFAEYVRALPGYHGQPIRLLSCKTGRDDEGFAQQLADALGTGVTAPTHSIWVEYDGAVRHGGRYLNWIESWRFFTPRGGSG